MESTVRKIGLKITHTKQRGAKKALIMANTLDGEP
jgi:hypothetical protein